ncbi:MAG: 50S ribosomal protein L4 [Bacteroidetes bacterium]|nr:50S ribosomal protein L4 [Bacteroidota bacterium]HET6245793.1 50S ribosomal protein L4 [Bacteroidia bacterium]
MEVAVLNKSGKATTKKVVLNDAIYGIEPNDHAIYLDVKQYLANQRQGTHKAKQRNEISGSTRKLHKQKGTGGARKGSIKNPLFRGGGRVFGPQPRDYDFKLNKKLKRLARMSALAHKMKSDSLFVLEDLSFDAPKTKNFIEILNNLKLSDKKTLLVLSDSNKSIYLSSRNLQRAKVVTASDLNTYDILNASILVLTEGSIEKIDNILSN